MAFRVLYILPAGRAERLQSGRADFPDDFFYGYCHLTRCPGWQADLMTRRFPSRLGFLLQKAVHACTNFSPDFSNASALNGSLLRQYDVVLSSSEPVLFMLALHKREHTGQSNLVLIMIGADKRLERSRMRAVTRRMLRWFFSRLSAVIVFGEGERQYLVQQHLIDPERLHLVQFGVDTQFWVPQPSPKSNDYILAVGNDDGRDYETLLHAIGEYPLRLHTARSLKGLALPPNVTVTRGNWAGQALSDSELRTLYWDSRFVVTPLRESAQPQGQSVTLQAMACGKAVILSRTKGLWSRDLMRHLHNCYLVPPGNVAALRSAIEHLHRDDELCVRLGHAARRSVEQHFSSTLMGESIAKILLEQRTKAAL